MAMQQGLRFLGGRELFDRLSELTEAILGVSGSDFVAGYRRGDYANVPVAQDLAAVLPFIETPVGHGAEG
jgi:hypothetical protein